MKFFEAVPNLSEGRDQAFLQRLQGLLQKIPNLWFLGCDTHHDAHRSVFTVVGTAAGLRQGLLTLYSEAIRQVHLPTHQGNHPRVGAVDVCPIVPLGGTTVEEAQTFVRELGEELARQWNLPLFLYQESARTLERRSLSFLRLGGDEGLSERMKKGFLPDFGPEEPHPTAGSSILGVRGLMLAYNVNLEQATLKQAKTLAASLRAARDKEKLANLRGTELMGWELAEEQRVQISCNLRKPLQAGPIEVFYEVKRLATRFGIRVTGSEVVGLAPLKSLVQQPKTSLADQLAQVREVVQILGLSDFRPFDPMKKILEFRLRSLGCPYEI